MRKKINYFLRIVCFLILLVVVFSGFIILNFELSNESYIVTAPGKDVNIEDPDDEDFGGIGIYSYKADENEII